MSMTFGFTRPQPTMPDVNPQDPSIPTLIQRLFLWIIQRLNILLHLQQSPLGPFVIQMQGPYGGTANVFNSDRMGFRQDGSNFLLGALDRVANVYSQTIILQPTDSTVLVDATLGALTVYLPVANTVPGRIFTVKKIDSTLNAVTVATQGIDTIEGVTGFLLPIQWRCLTCQSDGLHTWHIIADKLAESNGTIYFNSPPPAPLEPFARVYSGSDIVFGNTFGVFSFTPDNVHQAPLIVADNAYNVIIGTRSGTAGTTTWASIQLNIAGYQNSGGVGLPALSVDDFVVGVSGTNNTPVQIFWNGAQHRVGVYNTGGQNYLVLTN